MIYRLLEESEYTYPSTLNNAHGTLYDDGYLWVLMQGTFTLNPVKIDATDLSSYTGIASNESIGTNQIVKAKGYLWSPKSQLELIIRRTDPYTKATTDYDGTGETALDLGGSGMYYDEGTECIFIGHGGGAGGSGFSIMDISDVDNPVFTYYDVDGVIPGFERSRFHSISGDGTYVYLCHKYKEIVSSDDCPGVLKVKASDPTYGGSEGWVYGEYPTMPWMFTDDHVCKDGYLYCTPDPINGSYPQLAKIATADLSLVDSIIMDDTIDAGGYGVWEHEGLLFVAITTSPGKVKIYDDLTLLYTYTFKTGYDQPNEIIFNDNKMWVTFWGTATLVIVELSIEHYPPSNTVIDDIGVSSSMNNISVNSSIGNINVSSNMSERKVISNNLESGVDSTINNINKSSSLTELKVNSEFATT